MHRKKKNADRAAAAAAVVVVVVDGLLLLLALDGSVDHEVGEVDETFSLFSLQAQKQVLKRQTAILQHFLTAAAAFNHTQLPRDFFFFLPIAIELRPQGTGVTGSHGHPSHPICQ